MKPKQTKKKTRSEPSIGGWCRFQCIPIHIDRCSAAHSHLQHVCTHWLIHIQTNTNSVLNIEWGNCTHLTVVQLDTPNYSPSNFIQCYQPNFYSIATSNNRTALEQTDVNLSTTTKQHKIERKIVCTIDNTEWCMNERPMFDVCGTTAVENDGITLDVRNIKDIQLILCFICWWLCLFNCVEMSSVVGTVTHAVCGSSLCTMSRVISKTELLFGGLSLTHSGIGSN